MAGLRMTALEKAVFHCPIGGGDSFQSHLRKQARGGTPCTQGYRTPWLLLSIPVTPLQPSEHRKGHPG